MFANFTLSTSRLAAPLCLATGLLMGTGCDIAPPAGPDDPAMFEERVDDRGVAPVQEPMQEPVNDPTSLDATETQQDLSDQTAPADGTLDPR